MEIDKNQIKQKQIQSKTPLGSDKYLEDKEWAGGYLGGMHSFW